MNNKPSAIAQWHDVVKTGNVSLLDELLADDVVFHSPVVWTPQEGKFITRLYLSAAAEALNPEHFKYTKEIISENSACLEFETQIGEITVNGVDVISWNEDGKITEFKVLVRPLKGMQAVHQKMGEMLERMKG